MKKIDIYIEECVRHLPKKTKEDVKKELQSEISEMVEAQISESVSQEEAIRKVLEELGDPKKLADRYLNKKSHLIGPQYYTTYLKVLKIVMVAVLIGLSVVSIVNIIFNALDMQEIIQSFVGIFNAELQVFAWVTIMFMLVERAESETVTHQDSEPDEKWSVKDLPNDIPSPKSSWFEGLFGSIFAIVAVVLLNFRIELFGVYMFSENKAFDVVPLFNQATMSQWLPWVNAMLAIIVISNLLKVASIKFSKKKEWTIIFLQLISVMLFVWIVVSFDIINPTISQEIAANNEIFASMVDGLISSVVWVIVFINIAEVLYKTYKLLKV